MIAKFLFEFPCVDGCLGKSVIMCLKIKLQLACVCRSVRECLFCNVKIAVQVRLLGRARSKFMPINVQTVRDMREWRVGGNSDQIDGSREDRLTLRRNSRCVVRM